MRNPIAALFAALSIAGAASAASAAVIDLDYDVSPAAANLLATPMFNFLEVSAPQPLTPGGPVELRVGDTVNVSIEFTHNYAVSVNGPAYTEIASALFTASGAANGGPTPITDLSYSFDFEFLGAAGDLLIPSISIPSIRSLGGGNMISSVTDQFTTSSFLFTGVAYSFTILEDHKAAAGVTNPSEILPLFFDVASFRMFAMRPDTIGLVDLPAPGALPLLVFGLAGAGLLARRRRAA